MQQIRILPEVLANKIAAGEVVERPASIVKELVENSLDAGADRILIDIENGGRGLIRVADNGCGMGPDDALLSVERFATSKIRSDSDLSAIRTLGFRGEALPSIAAVSHLTLITREAGADSGTEVRVEGGKILDVRAAGTPAGTMISVERLFFNTPARRKFLRSVNTEMAHIADCVCGMALGRPQVQFRLSHNRKTVRHWPRAAEPAERAADILGQISSADLISLQGRADGLQLSGFLGPARSARSTARGIFVFVNSRRVHDRIVQHALLEGFSGRLMKGSFPAAVLFLEMPFDEVDVNVHPTKHEVRFADSRRVHDLVRDRVAAVLNESERGLRRPERTLPGADDRGGVVERPPVFAKPVDYEAAPAAGLQGRGFIAAQPRPEYRPVPWEAGTAAAGFPANAPPGPDQNGQAPAARQEKLWPRGRFRDLTVIGQFRGTYIICQEQTDLILIDQHAAHERIVYEQLGKTAGRIESQRLLMPETIEPGYAEACILERLIPHLDGLGLEVEAFGGKTFIIKAVPAVLDDRDIGGLLLAIAERTAETGFDAGLERVLDQCRMVMACHNAVRARQQLTQEEIQGMLAQLDRCENSSHCPHGRPIWIRWTARELEKAFGRV